MRQTLWSTAVFAALGCAAAPANPAPSPVVDPAPTATAPAAGWSDAIASEAAALTKSFPDATVRIGVVDVETGDLVASHGPVTAAHPVGSTVKTFTVAAALAAGIAPSQPLETGDGTITFEGQTIQDHTGHGTITVKQALARSSNVGVVRLVERVGVEELYRRVKRVIPLPERPAGDDLAAAALLIGAHLELTTADLLRGYAVLARGGTAPGGGERLIDASAAEEVMRMLEHAVAAPEGTGNNAAVQGRRVAGKTGTAPRGDGHTALFVGVVEAEGRRVIIGVVVDGVPISEFGGSVAAPAFARLVRQASP